MKGKSVYEKCPVYTSDHFLLRLVEEGDAEDLLHCYSDPLSVRLMNDDNCTGDFHFRTLEGVNDCIKAWLRAYEQGSFVRFSIVGQQSRKVVGTVEMFSKVEDTGILRVDICSAYETQDYIFELLRISTGHFYDAFCVQQIMTKAIPMAAERISALLACGFTPVEHNTIMPYDDYFVRNR